MADLVGEFFVQPPPALFEIPVADQGLDFPAEFFTNGGGTTPPATVNYVQRVFSSGLGVWCYYTQTSINPTPSSGDTTPNWTGAITAFELLAIY